VVLWNGIDLNDRRSGCKACVAQGNSEEPSRQTPTCPKKGLSILNVVLMISGTCLLCTYANERLREKYTVYNTVACIRLR